MRLLNANECGRSSWGNCNGGVGRTEGVGVASGWLQSSVLAADSGLNCRIAAVPVVSDIEDSDVVFVDDSGSGGEVQGDIDGANAVATTSSFVDSAAAGRSESLLAREMAAVATSWWGWTTTEDSSVLDSLALLPWHFFDVMCEE